MIEPGPAGSPASGSVTAGDTDSEGPEPDGDRLEDNDSGDGRPETDPQSACGDRIADLHSEIENSDPDDSRPDESAAPPFLPPADLPPDLPPDLPETSIDQRRLVEAVLFAASEPVDSRSLAARLPSDADLDGILRQLSADYSRRGVRLEQSGDRWAFRTAPDLGRFLDMETTVARKLSRAAVETLAIVAYHQPVTRADIEDIRGVALSKGTLDTLLEAGWLRPRGRRRAPGRPMTWGTTEGFLDHFGLASLDDLPGVEELRQTGLLDSTPGMQALREQVDEPAGEPAGDDRQGDLLAQVAQAPDRGPVAAAPPAAAPAAPPAASAEDSHPPGPPGPPGDPVPPGGNDAAGAAGDSGTGDSGTAAAAREGRSIET